MAQRQANISLPAPGIKGINTEDSPITVDEYFVDIAENAVFDKYGRLGARKGYVVQTSDASALGGNEITRIHEFIAADGTKTIFSTGNNKIFSGTTTLTDVTGAATITGDDWQMVTLNDDCFFIQPGHDVLVWDESAGALVNFTAHANYGGTTSVQADAGLAAYGRLWLAKDSTVYWSDLLIGPDLDNGSSGSIDITEVWPYGYDEIVALGAHNNFLIIFGKESVVVYGSSNYDGALASPAADLTLVDTVQGIGCLSRHTVVNVGPDLLFVDASGLRSFGRVIQQKSMPLGELSSNVRTQLKAELSGSSVQAVGLYSPDEGFYLLNIPDVPHIYCFDIRRQLEGGVARVTTWTGLTEVTGLAKTQDGTVYLGTDSGICKYSGYLDGTDYYMWRLHTNYMSFGDPSRLKFPKQVDFVIYDGNGQSATCFWSYEFSRNAKSQPFILNAGGYDEYNIDEYNITTTDDPDDPTEYMGASVFGKYKINLTGQGNYVSIGLEVKINGYQMSLQDINIQTLVGRIM